jgi:hypothetical protein
MFQKLLLMAIPIFLVGCAPMLLAPLSVAGAAAEQRTGKSPISTFLSKVTGDDCDLKRVLDADYPCVSKKQINEVNQSTNKEFKP